MTTRHRIPALTCAALLVLGAAGPGVAAVGSVDDPAGDQSGSGLDITRARVDNRDRAIVVRIRFAEAKRGDLIVSLDPRRARGLRLISRYRPDGTTRNHVSPFAFSDGERGRIGGGTVDCDGFRVRWNAPDDRARLVLPSTCLRDGDYGALRFAVLTERPPAGDVDYAPDSARRSSAWIPRG